MPRPHFPSAQQYRPLLHPLESLRQSSPRGAAQLASMNTPNKAAIILCIVRSSPRRFGANNPTVSA